MPMRSKGVRASDVFVTYCLRMAGPLGISFLMAGCAPTHSDGSLDSSGEQLGYGRGVCGALLRAEFESGYRPFLQANCINCHVSGGEGKGAFADSNIELSYDAFSGTGFQKVSDFAVNPSHKAPYTGSQHSGVIDSTRASWLEVEIQYNECLTNNQRNDDDPPLGDSPPNTPRLATVEKVISATSSYVLQVFDLETEMAPGNSTFAGAKLQLEVRSFTTPTGEMNYNFRNPKLSAGGIALQITDLRIVINGIIYEEGTTWKSVNRKIPANQSRDLSTGVLIREGLIKDSDTMGLSFGALVTTTFNPTRFSQLVASGGTFSRACVGCHGASNPRAGLNILNYQDMLNHFVFVPFDPTSGSLLSRMNNATNPMPPSDLVPVAERQAIEDWILDGAPNN
jgi:mono/diheme cytochrome c family protein